jgi:CRP-like cAMP-binding protein
MSTRERPYHQVRNRILAALAPDEYERLSPHFEHVELPRGRVLIAGGEPIRHVYFPDGALISQVTQLSDGSTVEAAVAGREGMAGLPVVWGADSTPMLSVVQIPGTAVEVRAKVIRDAFARGGALQSGILRYAHALLIAVSQTAACNSHHRVEARLARWLLASSDAAESDELPLTHEFIATMMGVRRAGVTEVAHLLREHGLISYTRGHIRVINREGLEAAACECYLVVKEQFGLLTNNGDRRAQVSPRVTTSIEGASHV